MFEYLWVPCQSDAFATFWRHMIPWHKCPEMTVTTFTMVIVVPVTASALGHYLQAPVWEKCSVIFAESRTATSIYNYIHLYIPLSLSPSLYIYTWISDVGRSEDAARQAPRNREIAMFRACQNVYRKRQGKNCLRLSRFFFLQEIISFPLRDPSEF